MSIRPSHTPILAAVILGLAATQCDIIIGLDRFRDCTTDCTGSGGATSSTTHASGTGGAATSTASSGGMACSPGHQTACYDGPAATEGVSVCKGGVKTCTPDGSAYGTCVGEIVPTQEDCYKKGDEDCDGNACSDLIWDVAFKDTNGESVTGLAVDSTGDAYVVGAFNGVLTIGAMSVTASGGFNNDYFLAKFDHKDGSLTWFKQLGDAGSNGTLIKVAIDGQDNVIIAGELRATIDFGQGPVSSMGNADIFVAKYSIGGTLQWANRFGGASSESASYVSADSQGAIFLSGEFFGSFMFGSQSFANATGKTHSFYAKLDATGNPVWSIPVGDPMGFPAGNFSPTGILPDAADLGSCFVTGTFDNAVNLGGATFTTNGGNDIYLAKLDPMGVHQWSAQFGSNGDDEVGGIASNATGDVAIVGSHMSTINFGPGAVTTAAGTNYIAVFDKAGTPLWSKGFGGAGTLTGSVPQASLTTGIGLDASGNVFIAAGENGSLDFGAGPLMNGGNSDVALGKLKAGDGTVLWNKTFGDAKAQLAHFLVLTPGTANIVIAGEFSGAVNFGVDTLNGNANAFLATFQH